MKSTGIVRQLDALGRVVLPIDIRRQFGIQDKGYVEIYTEGDTIVLKRSQQSCIFCGKTEDLGSYLEKPVCGDCASAIYENK